MGSDAGTTDPRLPTEWFECLPCGVIVRDRNGRVVYSNPKASELLDIAVLRGKCPVRRWYRVTHEDGTPMAPTDRPVERVGLTRVAEYGLRLVINDRSGRRRTAEINHVPLDVDGEPLVLTTFLVAERVLASETPLQTVLAARLKLLLHVQRHRDEDHGDVSEAIEQLEFVARLLK